MQRPLAGRAQIQTGEPHERINLMSKGAEHERLTVASRRDRAGPVIGPGADADEWGVPDPANELASAASGRGRHREVSSTSRATAPTASIAGPTFGLEELAGRKVIALFDRAEARDFADVFTLAQRYEKELLLRRAAEIDTGFDRAVFATMLRTLGRFTDDEIPIDSSRVAHCEAFSADG